jgi:hypothetical protein
MESAVCLSVFIIHKYISRERERFMLITNVTNHYILPYQEYSLNNHATLIPFN